MAIDPRKRQKKLERKRAKDKAHAIARRKYEQIAPLRLQQSIAAAPIRDCFYSDTLWDQGLGSVVLCRQLPNNQVAFGVFLLDVWCLGVKNAIYEIAPASRYEANLIGRMNEQYTLIDMEPHCARKLVEGAVAYAQALGFRPHADYEKAKVVFGDIDVSACAEDFKFGKDGRPIFIPGPSDGPERLAQVARLLDEPTGKGRFRSLSNIFRHPKLLSDAELTDEESD